MLEVWVFYLYRHGFQRLIFLVDGDVLGLIITYAYIGVIVIIASKWDYLKRTNMHRKFIHVMIGNIVVFWWVFDTNWIMSLLAAAPFIPVLIIFSKEGSRHDQPHSKIEADVRKSILAEASVNGHKLGLVYYAISWALLAFFAFDNLMLASVGIVCMAYGDGMGGLIGKKYGSRRIHDGKTLEGTLAVFTFALAACIFVFFFYDLLQTTGTYGVHYIAPAMAIPIAFAVAAYVAITELYTPGEYDNLVIPLSTVALLWLLGV
jgi:phytol kinase